MLLDISGFEGTTLMETEAHTPGTRAPPRCAPFWGCQEALCSEGASTAGWWPDGIHPGRTFLSHQFKSTDAIHRCGMWLPPPHVKQTGPPEEWRQRVDDDQSLGNRTYSCLTPCASHTDFLSICLFLCMVPSPFTGGSAYTPNTRSSLINQQSLTITSTGALCLLFPFKHSLDMYFECLLPARYCAGGWLWKWIRHGFHHLDVITGQ